MSSMTQIGAEPQSFLQFLPLIRNILQSIPRAPADVLGEMLHSEGRLNQGALVGATNTTGVGLSGGSVFTHTDAAADTINTVLSILPRIVTAVVPTYRAQSVLDRETPRRDEDPRALAIWNTMAGYLREIKDQPPVELEGADLK